MLPVERETVLGAKWLGSILRGRYLGYILAGYLAPGVGLRCHPPPRCPADGTGHCGADRFFG